MEAIDSDMQQLDMKNNDNHRAIGAVKCPKCGKSFSHERFVDHLFSSKECMRKYWEEEEKTHSVRMRHKKNFGF